MVEIERLIEQIQTEQKKKPIIQTGCQYFGSFHNEEAKIAQRCLIDEYETREGKLTPEQIHEACQHYSEDCSTKCKLNGILEMREKENSFDILKSAREKYHRNS